MKKMIIFGFGLLLATGAMVTFVDKPLTAEQELLLRNVEAIARQENDKKGYAWVVDMSSPCSFTDKDGNPVNGVRASCQTNAGDLESCASGCITSADLH